MAEIILIIGIAKAFVSTFESGNSIKRLISSYQGVPSCYEFAAKQCFTIQKQLSMLQALTTDENWKRKAHKNRIQADHFVNVVLNCAETLTEFQKCVGLVSKDISNAASRYRSKRASSRVSVKQRLRHMWRKDDIERLGYNLKFWHDNIATILTILQAGALTRIEDQVEKLQRDMSILSRHNANLYRTVRILHNTYVVPVSADETEATRPSNMMTLADVNNPSGIRTPTASDDSTSEAEPITLSNPFLNLQRGRPRQCAVNVRSPSSIPSFSTFRGARQYELSSQMRTLLDWVEKQEGALKKKITTAEASIDRLQREAKDKDAEFNRIRSQVDNGEAPSSQSADRLRTAEAQIKALEEDVADKDAKLNRLYAQIADMTVYEKKSAEELMAQTQRALEITNASVDRLRGVVAEKNAELEQFRTQMTRKDSHIFQLERQLTAAEEVIAKNKRENRRSHRGACRAFRDDRGD